jgi:hypothetical protein
MLLADYGARRSASRSRARSAQRRRGWLGHPTVPNASLPRVHFKERTPGRAFSKWRANPATVPPQKPAAALTPTATIRYAATIGGAGECAGLVIGPGATGLQQSGPPGFAPRPRGRRVYHCRPRGIHHAGLLVHCHQWLTTFANAKDILVLRDGLADWTPVRDLPELRSQTAPSPPPLPAPRVPREAKPSRSSALSDIRPNGRFATLEEKAKHSTASPITTANVIGAFAILAIFVFAFAMGKRGGPTADAPNRENGVLSANAELPPTNPANQIGEIPKVTGNVTRLPTVPSSPKNQQTIVAQIEPHPSAVPVEFETEAQRKQKQISDCRSLQRNMRLEPGLPDLPHPALGQDITPSPTARRRWRPSRTHRPRPRCAARNAAGLMTAKSACTPTTAFRRASGPGVPGTRVARAGSALQEPLASSDLTAFASATRRVSSASLRSP